ncbi:MAG: hypothetical protein LBF89_07225 [Bacteroidales bacterium]|jgi:uncharacterized iron-regulated protein|nr:hypothetical protein [Bacteroidales bacterium]
MKSFFRKSSVIFTAAMLAVAIPSCKDNDNGNDDNDELLMAVLESYVDKTIIPTYKTLAEAALKMREANAALKSSPTDANMAAASDAWMVARVAWEINEAFLFGPVGEDALDIDGHIDSWPLEIEQIRNTIDEENGEITGAEAWNLDSEVIGFHVTEYLLYKDGQTRPVGDLTTAELNYLTAATDALVWDCVLAYVAWVGEENVSAEMKTVFRENPDVVSHLDNNPNFKNFATKMKLGEGTKYSSAVAAVSEIWTGAADIANEVGETKIASPYETGKTEEVESWYSWHSLDDYKNNIESIKNAYLGGVNNDTRTAVSLSTYVATKNAKLDGDIKAKIEETIDKIGAIGTGDKSFYEVVRDQINKAQVDAAVNACVELAELFTSLEDIIE